MKESSDPVERAMEIDSDDITNGNISSGEAANLVDALQEEIIRLRSELALAMAVVEAARSLTEATLRGGSGNRDTLTDSLDAAVAAFDAGRKP